MSARPRVAIILEQIAELAATVNTLAVRLVDRSVAEDADDSLIIRYLSEQVGWLADLGCEQVGGIVSRGDATQWMLPPSYHDHDRGTQ